MFASKDLLPTIIEDVLPCDETTLSFLRRSSTRTSVKASPLSSSTIMKAPSPRPGPHYFRRLPYRGGVTTPSRASVPTD